MASSSTGKRSSTSTALAFGHGDGATREGSRLRARSLVGGRPGDDAATASPKLSGIGMTAHGARSTTNLPRLDEATRRLAESSESGSEDLGPPTPPDDVRPRMSFELPKLPSASQFMSIVIPPTPAHEVAPPLLGRRFSIVQTQSAAAPAAIGPSSSPPDARPPMRALGRHIALLAAVFVTSTAVVFALIASVPALSMPHSLADVVALADRLRQYGASGLVAWSHVLVVLSALFCWKQAFSSASMRSVCSADRAVPGSILMNVLFGASYRACNARRLPLTPQP